MFYTVATIRPFATSNAWAVCRPDADVAAVSVIAESPRCRVIGPLAIRSVCRTQWRAAARSAVRAIVYDDWLRYLGSPLGDDDDLRGMVPYIQFALGHKCQCHRHLPSDALLSVFAGEEVSHAEVSAPRVRDTGPHSSWVTL